MTTDFDFISATDRPALVAINNVELLGYARDTLTELGYKVHHIESHEEFSTRFGEIQYQVLMLDESFGGDTSANPTLQTLQNMGMNQRRHATIILLGENFETLNAMQAFQKSVHAVINYSELNLLPQLIQKVVSDNDVFLQVFRETIRRVAQQGT